MKAYSEDLRWRVIAAVNRGMGKKEAAELFMVSVPTINRWLKLYRETGEVALKPKAGRPSIKGMLLEGWLPGHLSRNPDCTLQQRKEAFERETGVSISTSTISRNIRRLKDE